MQESLTTTVVLPDESEATLEVIFDLDSLTFCLNGKEIFSADWSSNLMRLFMRALQRWFDWDMLK